MTTSQQNDDPRRQITNWVRDHGPAVRGYLRARLHCPHAAEDLLQETFCRAWQARDHYAAAGKDRAYLLTIAERLAHDYARSLKRHGPTVELTAALEPVASAGASPVEWLTAREQQAQLAAALEILTEPQRQTLLWRFFGGLSFAEIAGQMNCPLGTVLSHCQRALRKMRQLLVESES